MAHSAGSDAAVAASSIDSCSSSKTDLPQGRLAGSCRLLVLCYLVAYLDRVNVGFAKLQMLTRPALERNRPTASAPAFSSSATFIFEVPSNVILHRVGARVWIARIMVTWGLAVGGHDVRLTQRNMFYVMRFFLGVAEAGFFPGIILYLTYWYPAHRRARMTAVFMTAVALSGVVGGPMSGWIVQEMAGVNGWAGWQWLFLAEGLPSVLIGCFVLFYLDDRIEHATWLNDEEKALLADRHCTRSEMQSMSSR